MNEHQTIEVVWPQSTPDWSHYMLGKSSSNQHKIAGFTLMTDFWLVGNQSIDIVRWFDPTHRDDAVPRVIRIHSTHFHSWYHTPIGAFDNRMTDEHMGKANYHVHLFEKLKNKNSKYKPWSGSLLGQFSHSSWIADWNRDLIAEKASRWTSFIKTMKIEIRKRIIKRICLDQKRKSTKKIVNISFWDQKTTWIAVITDDFSLQWKTTFWYDDCPRCSILAHFYLLKTIKILFLFVYGGTNHVISPNS